RLSFLLERQETILIVGGRRTQALLLRVLHRNGVPQTQALITDARNQRLTCQERLRRTRRRGRRLRASELEEVGIRNRTAEQARRHRLRARHQLARVDQIQRAVRTQTFEEQRVTTRIQQRPQVRERRTQLRTLSHI